MRMTWKAALVWATLSAAGSAANAQTPVKIGVLTDMTAVTTDLAGQGSVEAAKMAAADFGGSVLGRKIEVISADFQFKPDLAASIATEWYDRDGVDLIVDVPNSGAALAVQDIARKRGKMVMFSSAGSPKLVMDACSPTSVQWTYDNYAQSKALVVGLLAQNFKRWFFITSDYAGGISAEEAMRVHIKDVGAEVVGGVRAPVATSDFSSYVLQAKSSDADAVVVIFGGAPTVRAVEAAREYGLKGRIVSSAIFSTDVKSIGLASANGIMLSSPFYWDLNDETRAWSQRFFKVMNKMPTFVHAGVYTEVLHYLKAVQAAGTTEGAKVAEKVRELPIDDFMIKNGRVEVNGMVVRDRYVFEVKKPAESKGEWDLYKLVSKASGAETALPLKEANCPLVK